MPNAMAPNAPWVEVWLSPHAIVMPGLRQAQLWADDVHDALRAARQIEERHACLAAVALERRKHVLGHDVQERPPLIARGDDVIDGPEGPIREAHGPPARAQHVERLRSGDLVDQVEADEQLGLPVREATDGVGVPDFLEEGR